MKKRGGKQFMDKSKKKMRKSCAIVFGHLEKVSSVIFGRYQKQITDKIREQYGFYALYKIYQP